MSGLMHGPAFWIVWATVLLLQQVTQTVSNRAKASGSWKYVAVSAAASHLVWFGSQFAIIGKVWGALQSGDLWALVPVAVFYMAFCSLGNVAGAQLALRIERGRMRVGAR